MAPSSGNTMLTCALCPKACRIAPGESGECRIRVNLDGRLRAVTYGYPCSLHVDPMEKKPLFHFLPGTPILSLATAGCNLHCKFCQNWEISQANPEDIRAHHLPPDRLPALCRQTNCQAVAYTYTEPLVYYEYTYDCCVAARRHGLKNVLVSAGYVNQAPLRELCRQVDAANLDLKAFSESFYRDVCDASLKPVLESLVTCQAMGVHVEITNLIVPSLNDSDADLQRLCNWIRQHMGVDTPLHFSRFTPKFRLLHLPPTPPATLDRAKAIAVAAGLRHVYIGNLLASGAQDTLCPKCNATVIARRGFAIVDNSLKEGACPNCQTQLHGVWR